MAHLQLWRKPFPKRLNASHVKETLRLAHLDRLWMGRFRHKPINSTGFALMAARRSVPEISPLVEIIMENATQTVFNRDLSLNND